MNREYCERWLKSCLKKKVSITSSTIIMFLMTGLIMTTPVYGALNDAGTGSASGVAQGTGSNAVGADSIAIGTTANSTGDRTIAIGKNASTNNYESIAIGNDSKTTSNNNIAIGKGAIASGNNNSIAFGNGSSATGNDGALAVGRDSKAGGNNSVSVGRNANARGNDTVAVGKEAEVTANEAVAIGLRAKASADRTIALGRDAKASSNEAIAIGRNTQATSDSAVAIGKGANASSNSTVALGQDSQATASGASALSVGATASGNNAVAISYNSKATATRTIAIGEESNASSEDGIALGYKTKATSGSAVAIGREVISSGNEAVALGKGSKATGSASLALATGSNATGNDSYAIGWSSDASANSTMAFGHSSKAKKNYDIAFGRQAETRDQGAGESIAIGHGAVSGSNKGGLDRNGTDAGGVAIGTGAYTGVNRDNISLNSSVAIGAGAGAGFRRLDGGNNNMPAGNATDVDNNEEVLKKAFGVKNVSDYTTIAGGANGYTNVDINEATALGRNARAIGDQAVAIGAQTIAGHGAVALGGNDITQFAGKKYYKSTKENFAVTETTDHNQDAKLSDDTISGAYNRLVGTALDTAYKATYAQDGSVVLGAQAHSGTPLGTALGTNSLIRKGAFGATAIGAGSQIQANAEAAVAIGMGSRANGSYAVAAGTASLAELGDVAIGYHAEATGKEGAISIGQATKAKGDSSIMIGGANIASAASQNTKFISEKQDSKGVRDTYFKDITETINGETVTRRYTYVTLEDKSDTIEKAYATLTGTKMNKDRLDYDEKDKDGKYINKNGHASTSVGVHSLAKGDLASAFGASSRANAIGSLALGTGAQALVQNSVAIGTGSIAGDDKYTDSKYDVTKSDPVVMGTRQLSVSYDKDGKIVSDAASNIAYTFKWAGGENTAPGDIVSFGTKGAERQLKHVAAGRIAENSTDAVNGSQLNAIIERFIGDKIKYFSVKSDATKNHYNDGATGKDSIAIGPDATATKDNATATGNKSKASEENATAYGYNTEATGKSSVALGTSAIKPGTTTLVTTEASGENATALGVASKAKGLNSVALGYGVQADKDFATAIGSEAKVTANKGIAIGKDADVSVEGGIALGAGSVASVAGAQTGISVDGEVEGARTNVYENLKNNVNNSKISGNNGAVSVGSPTATRQIVNLAAGTNDTDAVNVAQLKSVNLAFKGNTGTGDVRLHDQRLSVVSSNTDLLTVEASDKKLTFTPKTATLNIDNTEGSKTLGKVVAPTTDGLVKASELANTLNNMYWNVATSQNSDTGAKHTGESIAPVKPGGTVNFIAGEHVTIGQDGTNITISMKDALTQVQLNNAIQQTFGNGKNTTLVTDASGGMKYSLNDQISLTSVATGTTVVSDGKVSGLNDNLTNTENKVNPDTNKSEPVKKAELPNTSTAVNKKNAATVGDVLNAGWNLQNNGEAKDFVRPYDTVNFVDGVNTKAVVITDTEGKVSKVTYNVVGLPMTYTDANGAPVSKVGDKYYKTDEAGNVLDKAGNPVTKYDTNGNPLNADDTVVNPVNDVKTNLVNAKPGTGKTGTTTPTQLGNVENGATILTNPTNATGDTLVKGNDGNWYKEGDVDSKGKPNTGAQIQAPTNIISNPTAGLIDFNNSPSNNVATVGDLRNLGWVVSAEGNTYSDQVRNANQVNFIGKNGITVTGETTSNGIRNITIETSQSPIIYTDKDGNKMKKVGNDFYPADSVVHNGNVYPAGSVIINGDVYPAGTQKLPDGRIVAQDGVTPVITKANPITTSTPSGDVIASLNDGSNNSSNPTTLSNVKSNLPDTKNNTATAGSPSNATKSEVAPNITDKTATNYINPNNAATVGDVLNAGWNLQGNGKAVDFVKPYDTVNFRDGGNTTVTYDTDGATSHMQVNVTGLPVTNTITDPTTGKQIPLVKVGDTYYPAKADGTPNIQKDANGNPANGYTIADNGEIYKPGDITFPVQPDGTKIKQIRPGATPVTINSNMSNPNVPTDSKNAVNTPTQLGNVANGAKTHNLVSETGGKLKQANDGNYYPEDKVNSNGSLAIDAGPGMTYPPVKPVEMGNDGKWYEKDNLDPNGNPKQGATEVPNPLKDKSKKTGLIDFANSNPNNVATVGDLRNMGWVVSSDKTTGDLETAYNDQVRNANEVKFVGTGMATVSGKTVDGVRTITVDVNAQKTVEEAQVPVVYTDEDGNKLTKIGDKFYNKAAVPTGVVSHNGNLYPAGSVVIGNKVYPVGSRVDGAGNVVDGAGNPATEEKPIKDVQKNEVKASMNSGDGKTNNPTVLSNVGSNLKQVVDPNGTTPGSVKNPDGTPVTVDGNPVTTTNKAPYTAKEIANMFQPHELNDDGTTKVDSNGKPVANKNYVNPHNAATVGDVLNTGWNLQNNGEARDFVKPYDTVNFVNGGNTTAVVTTDANGTTSHVTYNVTGLPVTYTTADGKPVSKVGDNYYVVNDKGQPLQDNGTLVTKYNSKGNPLNDDGTPVTKQDTTTKPLKTNLVNPNVATVKQTTTPTQLGNVANGAKTYAAPQVNEKDVVQAKDGKWYNATDVVNGTPNKNVTPVATPVNPGKSGLVDFSDSNPTNVATVGDLRNMGWVVSSDKTTGNLGTDYNDQVRNANEVKFVGTGTATVSGKTVNGVRTITVKVNDQVSTNNSVTPVVYTKVDGTKVYPVKNPTTQNIEYHTTPDGKGEGDQVVPKDQVITSVNGPNGTTNPTTLKNIAGNLPKTHSDTKDLDGTTVVTPTTSQAKPDNIKDIVNNAATVGDVLNAGWNLQNNGTAKDFVKPYDTINFINGLGTTAVVTTRDGNTTSDVTFNVKAANGSVTVDEDGVKVTTGEMKPAVDANNKETGAIATPADPATAKQLKDTLDAAMKELATAKDALKTAETALAANPTNPALQQAVKDKKAEVTAKQTRVDAAQKAHDDAGLNKIATVQNVAEAINNAGFNLKTSAAIGGEKLAGSKDNGELIKPSNTVEMVAGKNLTVKQDEHGKITYATKDNVTFKNVDTGTLNVGSPNTYTDGKGNTYTKVGDQYYNPADVENGAPKPVVTPVTIPADAVMKPVNPVTMKTEAAKPATNNDDKDAQPSSALNITSKDGKPTQITGVGSVLNTQDVTTSTGTQGTTPATSKTDKLVNLTETGVNKNAVATVGDLANMGWVVSASDNAYTDTVKNANKVDFKGVNGIEVTGKTTDNGIREITIGIKKGQVTNEVTVVRKDGNGNVLKNPDGTDMKPIEAIRDKDGKLYAKDKNGKADKTNEITLGEHDTVTNNGSGFVTGNTVATAIQESGWNVGKADAKDVTKAFEKEAKLHDKVNPNDNVKFVDGDNTTVSMVTIDSKDEAGTKVATTYIKTDINRDIHIDSVTTGGKITNNAGDTMMLGNDGNYYPAGSVENNGKYYPVGSIVNNGNVYPAGSVVSKNGNVYPVGTTLDKNGNPTTAGTTPVSPIITSLTPTLEKDVKIAPKTELTDNGIKMTPDKLLGKDKEPNKVVNLTNLGLNNGGNNITNVEGNLDGAKTGTTAPTTNHAGVDTTTPTAANYVNSHNAATVGDVLNAGWNLQNNGKAKDFVKPYDTVNFINGGNTTAVVTTDNGTTSNVTYNVTGLPISYTDKDGKPVSKVGDNYYVVNDKGQPLQDDGTPVTKYDTKGNPLNNNGSPVTKVDTSKNPLTINLVNPNVSADKAMKTPMKIGNIESGAKTFDAPKDKNGNPLTKANDGKWYLSNEVDSNGIVKKGAKVKDPVIGNVTENNDPRKAGLINFGDSKSNATNVATVGDLQNMGWVVSTSDTGYNDQVRNANVVDFKEGEGIKISGETLENGVRQIKVGIDKNIVATKQELAQVERLSSAGIAGVAAMANIPQINEAASNRYNIAVGVGYHKGEKALAVGISGVSDGGRVVYKASAALDSQKQTTVGLGVGYQFGKRDIEPNELDRFRAQLDLVNTQKSSLAQRLKEQSIEIEELKKQNKILNEKIDMILRNNSNK